ncbi:multidrug ABC transporter ATP-binding protein [Amycolatopsis antarctica]|uniref:Multidrug ABC transporter ATP-binding protein n=1 Tax=Amycolatopsis antarctica TaxID=1854586 RepID=A0A263D197_9PSEU|nr:ABC transporter ATP-binding protein [Amycolatopsis antarctica]OZM72220.1 multidrug ABC transporter ATP-binding protein [Amycolatopsis antarctica]
MVAGQRGRVLASSLLSAAHQSGEALVPVIIGVVIDIAVSRGEVGPLLLWLGILAVVFAVLSFSFRFSLRVGERAVFEGEHGLRMRLAGRVLDARGGAEAGRLPGALANVATSDAQRVSTVNFAIPLAVAALAGLLVGAVALLRVSVGLGVLVLLLTPLLLLLARVLAAPLERRSDTEQERAATASGVAADLVSGLRVLKGIGAERAAADRYREVSGDSLGAAVRAARARAWLDGSMLAVTGIAIAVVALIGGRMAVAGSISVGEFVAAVGLAQFLLWPLLTFSQVAGHLARARASAARVADVLAAPAAAVAGTAAPADPVRGSLALHAVSCRSVHELTFTAGPGEFLGVMATDPADADALVDCLMRETEPAAGTITLDGVPVRELDLTASRATIVVAEHAAHLFEGTVAGNIAPGGGRTGEPGAGPLRSALAAARADEVIEALPERADTVVAERGGSLSGGQRQRIALARALAADAPVLVLHEPTTAVDAVTEGEIAEGVRNLRAGRTTIVVTGSPALLAAADRVVLLDGGRIVAEGTHNELTADDRYRASVLA